MRREYIQIDMTFARDEARRSKRAKRPLCNGLNSGADMSLLITLDGPAGVGKSTLARRLATELRIPFLDTGAMFRLVAFHLGEEGLALPEEALAEKLRGMEFTLVSGEGGAPNILCCNGKPAGPEIRTEAVGLLSARFATMPVVRSFLKEAQQALGRRFALVAEGRDMGTEVFPFAPVKFFLDARPRVRAERRRLQLAAQGQQEDLDKLEAQIIERDQLDRNRAVAPLRPAKDAIIVDTSDIDEDGVFAILLHAAQKKPAGA